MHGNMQDNIPAVLAVMKFIYENIMYAELNTKSDYCQECGFDGEIEVVEEQRRALDSISGSFIGFRGRMRSMSQFTGKVRDIIIPTNVDNLRLLFSFS